MITLLNQVYFFQNLKDLVDVPRRVMLLNQESVLGILCEEFRGTEEGNAGKTITHLTHLV
jgi:hypothetical protein